MMNRYRFLPSYHYEDNTDGKIQNPATDQLRDYTIHGNHGKNLIPYPYVSSAGTQNGVTITIDSDGIITLNGTATATIYFGLLSSAVNSAEITKPGKYTISGMPGAVSGVSIQCHVDGAWGSAYVDSGNVATFTVASSIKYVTLQINKGAVCENVIVKPQLEEGETATAFEKWCGVGDKTINEIPYPFSDGTKTESGITFTDNGDGSLTLNGTATPKSAYYNVWSRCDRVLDKNKKYLLTTSTTIPWTDAFLYMRLRKESGNTVAEIGAYSLGYKIADLSQYEFDTADIRVAAVYQKTFDNAVFKPILIDLEEQNLISYPYYDKTDGTVSGVTRTMNADGSVTLNGTATGTGILCYFTKTLKVEKGKRYFLSGLPDKTTTNTYRLIASFRDSKGNAITYSQDVGKGVVFSGYDGDYANLWIYVLPYTAGAVFDNLTLKPTLVPVDFEPHGYRIPIVNDTRENLISMEDYEDTQTNSYYIAKNYYFTDNNNLAKAKGKKVVYSSEIDNKNFVGEAILSYNETLENGENYVAFNSSNGFTVTLPNATPKYFQVRARSNSADLNGTTVKISNISLKLADIDPDTTTIYTADQVMDGESISFRKNGLPAVRLSESNQLSVETAVKPSAVEYNYYTY